MSTVQLLERFNDVFELLKREEVFRELVLELTNLVKIILTAVIPITLFGEKVLTSNFNSIAALKALLMMKSNLIQTRKNPIGHVKWC